MRSKYELKCEKELRDDNWWTDYKIRPTRPMQGAPVDYFHLGDILAVKQNQFKFISVKGKTCPKQHKEDLQRFANLLPTGVSVELWQYKKIKNKITKKVFKYENDSSTSSAHN